MNFWLVLYVAGQLVGTMGPYENDKACQDEMIVQVEIVQEMLGEQEFEIKCEKH